MATTIPAEDDLRRRIAAALADAEQFDGVAEAELNTEPAPKEGDHA